MEQKMPKLDRDGFAYWFILAAVSRKAKKTSPDAPYPSTKAVIGWEDLSFDNCNIEFKINGVDVDFLDMMERIEESHDHAIKRVAEDLVKDKLKQIDDEFEDIKDMTLRAIREKFENKEESDIHD